MPNTTKQAPPNSFSGFTYTNNSGTGDAIVYLQVAGPDPILESRSFIALKPTLAMDIAVPNPAIAVPNGESVSVTTDNLILPFWFYAPTAPAAPPVHFDYHPNVPPEGVTSFAIWVWNAALHLCEVWLWGVENPSDTVISIAATHANNLESVAAMTLSVDGGGGPGTLSGTPNYQLTPLASVAPGRGMPEYGTCLAGTVGNPNPNPPPRPGIADEP